jgi:hypothetical protein
MPSGRWWASKPTGIDAAGCPTTFDGTAQAATLKCRRRPDHPPILCRVGQPWRLPGHRWEQLVGGLERPVDARRDGQLGGHRPRHGSLREQGSESRQAPSGRVEPFRAGQRVDVVRDRVEVAQRRVP